MSSPLGNVSFTPPAGEVIYYEARIYAEGTTTPVLATKYLGKPGVGTDGKVLVNVRTMLDARPAGNYHVVIAAVGAGGTDESDPGPAYVVPLELP